MKREVTDNMAAHLSDETPSGPAGKPAGQWLVLAAILGLGLLLRTGAVDFGTPSAFARPDEELGVREALFLLGGDPHVHFHSYGDGWPRLLALVYRWEGRAQAVDGAPPILAWMRDPLPFHRTARAVSAVLGGLTILLVWALARLWGGRRAGLWAAGIYAMAPLAVLHAHFATVDTLGAFLMALAVLITVMGQGRPALLLAALLVGAAAGVKLPLALGLAAPFLTLRGPFTSRFSQGALLILAFLVGLVAVSPSWLTEPTLVWERLVAEGASQAGRRGDLGIITSGGHLLRWGVWAGLGPVSALAAVAALPILAQRRGGLLPFLLGAGWLLFHAAVGTPFSRYILPALPLLAGAAGVGMARWQGRLPAGSEVLLVAVLVYSALAPSLEIRGALGRPDTRGELLRAFDDGRLPRDAYVLVPGYVFGLGSPAADLTIRAESLSGPGKDCPQRRLQWESASRRLALAPAPRPIWQHLGAADAEKLALDGLSGGAELLFAFLWTDDLFAKAWSGEALRQRVFRDLQRSAAEGKVALRLLWTFDPSLGASSLYEPWDYWFVPVIAPTVQRRPGPRIEVWSVKKK